MWRRSFRPFLFPDRVHRHVLIDDVLEGVDRAGGGAFIFRGIDDIIEQLPDGCRGDVHPCIGGGVVDKDVSVIIRYPAVAEDHVGGVADALLSSWAKQIATWF